MSLIDAFEFIQTVKKDEKLAAKIKESGLLIQLDQLVDLGGRYKLFFTRDELRLAFARDWTMRWCHYNVQPKR